MLLILSVHPLVLQETQNTSRSCGYSRIFNGQRQLLHAYLSVFLSARPPARPPAWNNSAASRGIFTTFDIWGYSEICRENSGFIKLWQEKRVFHMKTDIQSWWYLAIFLLEWKCFRQSKKNQNTHFIFNKFAENRAFCEIMWKNNVHTAGRGWQYRKDAIWMQDN